MEKVIELLERYGVDTKRVISIELLQEWNLEHIESMLQYLDEIELLRSK